MDGLQLLLLSLLKSLLVGLVGLLDALIEIVELLLAALFNIFRECSTLFIESVSLLLQFILHRLQVGLILLGELLEIGLSSFEFRHHLNDVLGVDVAKLLGRSGSKTADCANSAENHFFHCCCLFFW